MESKEGRVRERTVEAKKMAEGEEIKQGEYEKGNNDGKTLQIESEGRESMKN